MQGTIPTYADLSDSGRKCSDVCDRLIAHTARKWCFDPWNGSSATERPDGHPVYVTLDDERPDVWHVGTQDNDTGRPLPGTAPVAVVVSADADPDAIAQALAPHVLALIPTAPAVWERTGENEYQRTTTTATGRQTGYVRLTRANGWTWEIFAQGEGLIVNGSAGSDSSAALADALQMVESFDLGPAAAQ